MNSFLRAFYLLMFAIPAVLLLAGVPRSSTREDVAQTSRSVESTLEGNLWTVPKYGLALRVPAGWAWMANGQREGICLDPNRRDRASINAIALPNFFGKNLIQLEAENVEALRTTPGIVLDASRRLAVDGVEILRFDYHGRQPGLDADMRYVCLLWLAGSRQVILTTQLEAARWPELGPGLEDALASLSLRAR
jgi:hypothetical protein